MLTLNIANIKNRNVSIYIYMMGNIELKYMVCQETKAGRGFDAFTISGRNLVRIKIFYNGFINNRSKACISNGISLSLITGSCQYQP